MAKILKHGTTIYVPAPAPFINTEESGTGTYEGFTANPGDALSVIGFAVVDYIGKIPGNIRVYRVRDHLDVQKVSTGEVGRGWPWAILRHSR